MTITLVIQALQIPEMKEKVKRNPTVKALMAEYKLLTKTFKVKPRFYGNFGYTTVYKKLGLKRTDFLKKAEEYLIGFENTAREAIEKAKQCALVTCFSKRNNSILMWSHYAESHTGVCFEYERPNTNDFIDVLYSKKKPKLKLYEFVSFMAAETMLAKSKDDNPDDELVQQMLEPFRTKSIDWKYEQEVRFLSDLDFNKNSNVKNENGEYYYKIGKPTKIYIGCRANGKEKQKLIKLAKEKKIKIVFLKTSKDFYSLEEKNNKKEIK